MISNSLNFIDQFGRQKKKLRISITDRCNFKCTYCMPEHPIWEKKSNFLSFEELFAFCQIMVDAGIEQIRITGGEPLIRSGVIHFISQLQNLKTKGLKRISLTTNGHYLTKYAHPLKLVGLDDLNVSLDTLNADQFLKITGNKLSPVLDGIERAIKVGLNLKINTVLMKNINEDQILDLVAWSKERKIQIRFIEFMPLDGNALWTSSDVVNEQQILSVLASKYIVNYVIQNSNPARLYSLDTNYSIGIISTVSNSFCGQCDRIRITAKGELLNCLFAVKGMDLKQQITDYTLTKTTALKQEILQNIHQYIWNKDYGFDSIDKHNKSRRISMNTIGG